MNVYKSGKDLKELLDALHTLDGLTAIDRVPKSKQPITIQAVHFGKTVHWSMSAPHSYYSNAGKAHTPGKGYSGLIKALSEMNQAATIDESIVILVLADTSVTKNFDGTINTVWFSVEPCSVGMDEAECEIDLKNGVARIEYPVRQITLTEAEFALCESRIALYDEFKDILYPIAECAFPSIGVLMDCESAFKYKASPLSSANFLADRLAGCEDIRFIHRAVTKKVRPLISMVGKRYVLYSQYDFVKSACDIIREHCVFHVENWNVSAEQTKVAIAIDNHCALYNPIIELQTGDTMGTCMSVTAYIRMGHGKIKVRKNNAYHWESFAKQGGVRSLFEGVFEAFSAFDASFMQNMNKQVTFDPDDMKPITRVVGKKRYASFAIPDAGTYELHDILYRVVNDLHCDLNPRYSESLATVKANFFNKIVGEDVIVMKAPKEERNAAKRARDALQAVI